MTAGIEIANATKSFGDRPVLRGVDLTIEAGTVTVILGPSGSGKSTLLRAINHLEPLDEGYVVVGGELIGVRLHRGRLKERSERDILKQRARIGFVFQNFNLFPHLTIVENISEAPIALGTPPARARERALALLERVGLSEKAAAYPRQLSGGQQQRVAIARALALEPEVLLFDEPTSALDPELVGDVLEVIASLAGSGVTLVVVTHEIGFARQVADRIVFLDDGVVVEEGAPDDVLDRPRNPRTREFLSRVL
ncbi:amino acid ABC transporter ATP-binding protein [Leifsonia shinshuensis]|uniref:amino acid ABC transporter ATP-binding protein n=1 Tax=Leifsonia shinshuensis TaxID=150026 RepID=UPI00285C7CFF|nr:amino acid ABC transporter ATP-binding protein [Leifsonia shinshuensis]MDR6972936.1 polar amino acid transport system ATP-binding protein [Leifsonia shinshuensis]